MMRYKIKASLIEQSWFEDIIFKTLDMYNFTTLDGDREELTHSPLAEFLRNPKTWGGLHRDLIGVPIEEGIEKRLEDFIVLYKSIKRDGYQEDSPPLFVWFDDDGFIRLYDGHHRLSIIRYLKLDPEIWVSTDWSSKGIDPTGIVGRDFPLAEVASSIWGFNRLYHFVNDPAGRLKDFTIQRPDSTERRDYILKNLTCKIKEVKIGKPLPDLLGEEGSVLDIGCSEGYLSHEIAKEGWDVTAIEKGYIPGEDERGRKLIAIARYLATIQNIKMKCVLSDWKDVIKNQGVFFDNILYLSVLHNEINALGEGPAFENLTLLRGKCKKLFIEIPDIKEQPDWAYIFKIDEIIPKLERVTKMKFREVWQGYRPILLFQKPL